MKFGLEKEMFLVDGEGGVTVVPASLPVDEGGLLVEARGAPHDDFTDAVFSLMASECRIAKQVAEACPTHHLLTRPVMSISQGLRRQASRRYIKGLISYQNIYGFASHRNRQSEQLAGIHLSITCPRTISIGDGNSTIANIMFDWVQVFRYLDDAFATEIRVAKRRPGFYELKDDGRIEYRSLPNDISLEKLMDTMAEYESGRSERG